MSFKSSPAPTVPPAPLTIDLPLSLIAKIAAHRKRAGLSSTSEVVRLAIRDFDFGSYQPVVDEHRQISVRLAPRLRSLLVQSAKKKKVSVGEMLRAALEALPTDKAKKKK